MIIEIRTRKRGNEAVPGRVTNGMLIPAALKNIPLGMMKDCDEQEW